jgi:hypothetical protein
MVDWTDKPGAYYVKKNPSDELMFSGISPVGIVILGPMVKSLSFEK